MKTAFIDSYRHCPRDGKRMVMDIGQDENEGDIAIQHSCLSCSYTEHAPRTVAEARHSDIRQVQAVRETLRQQLEKLRLEGVVVALKYDAAGFPEEDW